MKVGDGACLKRNFLLGDSVCDDANDYSAKQTLHSLFK